jgi:peptidoglycan/xylan/chitin deacetylase (PgdA/CDA1 family)
LTPSCGRAEPQAVVSVVPHYYSSLAPFRAAFAAGLPILTYHKLGPRPRRVRLKGLYLSTARFDRQLAELRTAGFSSTMPDSVCSGAPAVVITFDDGFQNVLEHGLPILARHGFRAIQFLLSDLLGSTNTWEQEQGEAPERLMDEAQVRDWLAAGHLIGSHTCTHPWLTRLPLPRAREEIHTSKQRLEDRFGVAIEHFCYPYGDWNGPVRELVAAAGYRTACTVEPGVNTPDTPRLALKRFTARYPSRNLRTLLRWLGWPERA